MTDREKIIKIIEENGTYNGRSLSFDYYVVQSDDLADALIENGYGNIAEWKRRAEVAERALDNLIFYCSNDKKFMCEAFGEKCPRRSNGTLLCGGDKCGEIMFDFYIKNARREIAEEDERK